MQKIVKEVDKLKNERAKMLESMQVKYEGEIAKLKAALEEANQEQIHEDKLQDNNSSDGELII